MTETPKVILIADDDENILTTISSVLSMEGYTVHTAENGEETLDKIKTVNPDLLLLDLNMPEMDGASVAHDLHTRASGKIIPIIIVSGMVLEDSGKQIDTKNPNLMFLKKP